MPNLCIMIKPASSLCNLRCRYCFYRDIASKREHDNLGLMSETTLETLVRETLDWSDQVCTFAFQGGEPTLAGLDFYQKLIRLQTKYNTRQIRIQNTIQTNGFSLDQDWAAFLHDNQFLVGLSLDGPAEIHNLNRVDDSQNGSFNRVMASTELLTRNQVEFNILCVVTGRSARSPEKIYRFFRSRGFRYLQFIPCLEPIQFQRGKTPFHLSPESYGEFLCRLFDLWYEDLMLGKYTSIRLFDNLVHMINGRKPEACEMSGQCSINLVVEGNGNVYPCDFFCNDHWLLGNITIESIQHIIHSKKAELFIGESISMPMKCQSCNFFALCRNGCKRYREKSVDEEDILYLCESYRHFFEYTLSRFEQVAHLEKKVDL
jgi:uncharacterized protein